VLLIKTGVYHETFTISSTLSGTASSPTTLRAYPGHSPVIDNTTGGGGGRIKILGAQHIVLDGLAVTRVNQGIYIEASSNVMIKNCRIYSIEQEGIHVMGNSSYVTIQNNTVYDTGTWIYNGEGIYVGTGSSGARDNTHHVYVLNNLVHDTGDEGIELKPGTHDCVVDGNRLDNIPTGDWWGAIEVSPHASGNQFWGNNPNHVIRNNILSNTDTAIRAGTGSLIYNNVIYGVRSGNRGIYVDNAGNDSYTRFIYHNTVHVSSASAIVRAGGTADIRNNIGPSLNGNLATNSAYFVDAARGDFHLVAGSAPHDAGTDLTSTVPTDLEGNPRSAGPKPDLGAYELNSGSSPPAPPSNLRIIR
jgi:parallel beta-helix repeat protein